MTIAVDWGRKANNTNEQKTGYVHKGASLAPLEPKNESCFLPISFLISLLEI